MRKLAAILLICILFAPATVRMIVYMQCTLQTEVNPACDCNISSVPEDQSASMPDRQKEILNQTDVKYLLSHDAYLLHGVQVQKSFSLYRLSCYSFTPANSIFRPPAIA